MANYQQQAMRRAQAGAISTSVVNAATTGLSAGLFIAAAASNAVPLGGQIASGVLAVAGLLVQTFTTGKRADAKATRQNARFAAQRETQQTFMDQGSRLGQRAQAGGAHGMISEEQKFAHHQPTTDWAQIQPTTSYSNMGNNGRRS
jgi:hypothetical protein